MGLIKSSPIRNKRVVSRIPEILRLCRDKKVLHLGCADVPYTLERGKDLLHKRLAEVTDGDILWGLDSSWEGVSMLREMGFRNILHGDAETMPSELGNQNFDAILAGEIIEHLANPGNFLKALSSIMSDKTELIVTTVNATALKQCFHAMFHQEKVHPDHNYYFSYWTLRHLLSKFNLNCKETYYYQESQGKGLGLVVEKVFLSMTRISPAWSDGLIARATIRQDKHLYGRQECI